MEEAPENGKESPHSAHANGMNEYICVCVCARQSRFAVHKSVSVGRLYVKSVPWGQNCQSCP